MTESPSITALESLRAELGEERAQIVTDLAQLERQIPELKIKAADAKAVLDTLLDRAKLLGKQPLSPIIASVIEEARIAARTAEGAHRLAADSLGNARARLATLIEAEAQIEILIVGNWPTPAIVRRPEAPVLSLAPLEPNADAA